MVAGVYPAFFNVEHWPAYAAIVVLSLIFGVLLIIPMRRRHADGHLAVELRRPVGGGDGFCRRTSC